MLTKKRIKTGADILEKIAELEIRENMAFIHHQDEKIEVLKGKIEILKWVMNTL